MDVTQYLIEIEGRAQRFLDSGRVTDRDGFIAELMVSMQDKGITLVVGGKSLGKSFLINHAIHKVQNDPASRITVLFMDMGMTPFDPIWQCLLEAATEAQARLLRSIPTSPAPVVPYLPDLVSSIVAIVLASPAAAPVAQSLNEVLTQAQKALRALHKAIVDIGKAGNSTAIVIDEADEALPGTNATEAKWMLSHLVTLTKQRRMASAVLLSSDLGYPHRLRKAGLNVRDITKVIVAPEVPEKEMKDLLMQEWGMGEKLAATFYNFFGGDIHTSYVALCCLIIKRGQFDPLAVEVTPLDKCLADAEARAHLVNIATNGFSLVEQVQLDKGAKLIAEQDVGGIVNKGAITYGMPPDMWENTACQYAVIPSSRLMRLKIQRAVQSPQTTPNLRARLLRWFSGAFTSGG